MVRMRVWGWIAVALIVPIAVARGQTLSGYTCVVYPVHELVGDDEELGAWIAATIPEVIEPDSWGTPKGYPADYKPRSRVLRYHARKKVLVVYHTAEVQKKVDAFLADLKKSLPRPSTKSAARGSVHSKSVVPVAYREPALMPAAQPAPEAGYPVPTQSRPPRHLFHFIIRYEGDGIIDDNVAKVIKDRKEKSEKDGDKEEEKSEPEEKPKPAREPEEMPKTMSGWATPKVEKDSAVTRSRQLILVLRNSDYPFQREWAVRELASIGWRNHDEVIAVLRSAARRDPAPAVRLACLKALRALDGSTIPVAVGRDAGD